MITLLTVPEPIDHQFFRVTVAKKSNSKTGLPSSQVGGNAGSAFGPLLAALLIIPHGQLSYLSDMVGI